MKKRILLIPLALLMIISLIACAAPAPTPAPAPAPTVTAPAPAPAPEKPTYHWRLSSSNAEVHPQTVAAKDFAKAVEEASGGRITMDIFSGDMLGDWVSVYEETMRGTIEIDVTCLSSVYDPRTGLVYVPYLSTSWDEIKMLYGPGGFVYDTIDEILRDQGLTLLSSYPSDFMGVGISGSLPPSPKDPDVDKELKIRVWADAAPEELMRWFGYMPTVLPWSEVYTSLQMGVIDGVCTNLVSMYDFQRDLIDYWIYDHSLFEGNFFIMNRELFDSLSAEDQDIIRGAAIKQQDIRMAQAEQEDLDTIQKTRDYGIEVILFTEEELAEFRARAPEEIWPALYPKIGKMILDDAVAWLEANK